MAQGTPEGVSAPDFREVLARWAGGVAIVAVRDVVGVRHGEEREPLLNWNRAYRAVTSLPLTGAMQP